MLRPWLRLAPPLLALVGAAAVLFRQGGERFSLDPLLVEAQARDALLRVGFSPSGEAHVAVRFPRFLAWAWERAAFERAHHERLPPLVTVSFAQGGEVTLRGGRVVELRRPLPARPGPTVPVTGLETVLRAQLARLVEEEGGFSLTRISARQEPGLVWQRGHFVRPLAGGWQEELVVELAGSSLVAFRLRLLPEASDLGLVMGRVAELVLARRLVYFLLGLSLVGLFLGCLEAIHARLRLPWIGALATAAAVFALATATGHSRSYAAFWAWASGVSLLQASGTTPEKAKGVALPWLTGILLACGSLSWPQLAARWGGWVPTTGNVLTESGLEVAGEAFLRAVAEEPLLRWGLPLLLSPFLGSWAAFGLAAAFGSLLHPLPAVPLPLGMVGEAAGQGVLGALAYRWGMPAALAARAVWELLRLGFFAPSFPWGPVVFFVLVAGAGAFLWRSPGS